MSKNEESLRFIVNNMRLEGMHVTDGEKRMIRDCLSGKCKVDDIVKDIIRVYSIGDTQ